MTQTATYSHARPSETGPAHVHFVRWWLGIAFLAALALGPLAVFSFAAVSFTTLALLWARERNIPPNACECHRVSGAILAVCAVWFVLNLVIEFLGRYGIDQSALFVLLMALAFFFPPLMVHLEYLERIQWGIGAGFAGVLVRVFYPLSGILMIATALVPFGFYAGRAVSAIVILQSAMFLQFVLAVAAGLMTTLRKRNHRDPVQRTVRRWYMAMFSVSILMFLVLIVSMIVLSGASAFVSHLSRIARCLPLMFFFVDTYYEKRFTFFDIFLKRGSFVFLLLVLLIGYFQGMSRLLSRMPFVKQDPWIYVLTLLPLLLVLPWLYNRLQVWLDRVWLGRSYSTVEAVKYFLNGVQDATTERELVRGAEERLSIIFQAPAEIVLATEEPCGNFQTVQESNLVVRGERAGAIRMGRRSSQAPYFSADAALLSSLADVFSSLLENVRLQIRKQEQEKKEQDLVLHASRSELKALRAQVNPHFLFNTLNVIAGLIHKDPQRAEETVEELAEVFRYTLKRSEKESVRFEEELDFVRAYLEIEKVRFGERLEVKIEVDPSLNQQIIPTMLVQTLVENAVKHGIASVRGTGMLRVRATRAGGQMRLEVSDNGRGFQPAPLSQQAGHASGYGLRNLAQRLRAHYGSAAQLHIGRDAEDKLTVVSIEIPVSTPASLKEIAAT